MNFSIKDILSNKKGENKFFVICGPCVIESEKMALEHASILKDICSELALPLIFKSSFDKANRTSIKSFRGPGIKKGLTILKKVKNKLKIPVTSDVHRVSEVAAAKSVLDIIQIPALLSRQTDLIIAAAKTKLPVNIKKGQFMAPGDMRHVIAKLAATGCRDILLCERGTFFGYGRLVNDMRSLVEMRALGCPVVFDATHSVQEPSQMSGKTGGNREMVRPLARAASAVGIDGLFLETHPEPDQSPSDGPNMIPLSQLENLLKEVIAIRETFVGS